MLLRAIGGFPPGEYTPRNRHCATITDFEHIPDVPFLKTHLPAPEYLPGDIKAIFLFGDPIIAVASTLQKRFGWQHFRNLGYTSNKIPDIINRDDLGYENVYKTWTKRHKYPVLSIKYEYIWDFQKIIELYIGRRIILPVKRKRTTRIDKKLFNKLSVTYKNLDEAIKSAPSIMLNTNNGTILSGPDDIKRYLNRSNIIPILPKCSNKRTLILILQHYLSFLKLNSLYFKILKYFK